MAVVFDHPKSLLDVSTHFCPGCGHGIVHRLAGRKRSIHFDQVKK